MLDLRCHAFFWECFVFFLHSCEALRDSLWNCVYFSLFEVLISKQGEILLVMLYSDLKDGILCTHRQPPFNYSKWLSAFYIICSCIKGFVYFFYFCCFSNKTISEHLHWKWVFFNKVFTCKDNFVGLRYTVVCSYS